MGSNNYVSPYYYPPPIYNPGSTWNYNWATSNQNMSLTGTQSVRSIAPPPPPPPPPVPYTSDSTRTTTPISTDSTVSMDKRQPTYYSSNPQGVYRTRRKDWSVDDAKRALQVEKEYNKRHKSQSLIIKFPDIELNREIVGKFHKSIESVHFQQPSTPRFCFVTLNDLADPEVVIKALNKTRFGQGFLTAEFKKDREDEINIGPEDIDPLTLYVGNLAQEVTKEDMVNTYPRQKRIDIGYAKKMKYTRYAFVSFKNVDDSIKAFQKTHSTQIFRRLNGTVGMPGEPKPQMPQRTDTNDHQNSGSPSHSNNNHIDIEIHPSSDLEIECSVNSTPAPWEMVDVSNWETDTEKSFDLNTVKKEPLEDSDDESDENEVKPTSRDYLSPFMPGSLEVAFSNHKPMVKEEIKSEKPEEENSASSSGCSESNDLLRTSVCENCNCRKEVVTPDKIKKEEETEKINSGSTYYSLRVLNKNAKSIDMPRVEVKREIPTPTLDEVSNDSRGRVSSVDTEESTRVKSEPDNEDEDDDEDDSSDDSDDFNFNAILTNIENRSKRLMKLKKFVP
ncbi:hypothetical protein NQ314_017810 [Rhamnusium bicolor]|uniref:RRM domain-containing protein n=1 Tax=Rhamnusium bicolor TaxID=1586634 RepID=A0AAV8WTW3_9CUCU|nr:hypothetical protein NQ314_017810 [Rhamnusium bicolor]